jgi:NTE family protein
MFDFRALRLTYVRLIMTTPIFSKYILLISLCISFLTSCATTVAPKINTPAVEPPATYLDNVHPQVVLVLGSGGARGFSHVGVLKVLERNHIPIDMIVGTSAGSIVGALYADQPQAAHVEKVLLEAKRENVIDFSIFNIGAGPISGAGLQKFLISNMRAQTFPQLSIPYIAVATNLETGQLHAFKSGPIAPAVNASSAAPPYFRPVKIYGNTFADGGLLDPVAVDVAKRFHPKIIIAVRLDYPLGKDMPTYSPGFFLRGFDLMLLQLTKYSAQKADVIITPDTGYIDMFEKDNRANLMHKGEIAAERAMPQIKKLLAERGIPLSR